MKRRNVFLILLSLFVLILAACGGQSGSEPAAQETQGGSEQEGAAPAAIDYPTKPIKIIVPFSSGGGTDILARVFAENLPKYLPNDVSIVVENIVGGAATIGIQEMLLADPDGYTIAMAPSSPITVQPHLGNTQYDLEDIIPVMGLTASPLAVGVKADAPWETFEEWLEDVKANPGKFSYASPGTGTTPHLAMETIALETGAEFTHVPFDGTAPSLAAVMGGHVDAAFVQEAEITPYVENGDLRFLFLTAESETHPDVDVLADQGIDFYFEIWTGIYAHKDLPEEIQKILVDAFQAAMDDPNVKEVYEKQALPSKFAGLGEFQQIIEAEYATFGTVLEQIELD